MRGNTGIKYRMIKSLTAVGRKVPLISFVERIGILNQSLNTLQTT